jgi:hypothetical protein
MKGKIRNFVLVFVVMLGLLAVVHRNQVGPRLALEQQDHRRGVGRLARQLRPRHDALP